MGKVVRGEKKMKKILIITSGVLPIPAVEGGAVETLIDIFITQNEFHKNYLIETISVDSKKLKQTNENFTKHIHIKKTKLSKILRNLYIPQVLSLIFKRLKKYPFVLNVNKRIKKNSYDYIIVENFPEIIDGLSLKKEIPVILHLHNDYFDKFDSKKQKILENYSKIVCVSDYIGNKINRLFPSLSGKIEVLYNCVNDGVFNIDIYSNQKKLEKLKSKYNAKNDENLITYFGRLVKHKGVDLLIEAFLKIDNSKYKLLIVGSQWYGTNKEDKFVNKVKKLIEGNEDKIIFTGYLDHKSLPNIYAISDLVVVPSVCNDASPLVIYEALAMKTPLIATKMGGIPYIVENEEAELIENNENIVANLSQSIEKILSDKMLRGKKVERGYEKFREKYTSEQYYKNFCNIIEN